MIKKPKKLNKYRFEMIHLECWMNYSVAKPPRVKQSGKPALNPCALPIGAQLQQDGSTIIVN